MKRNWKVLLVVAVLLVVVVTFILFRLSAPRRPGDQLSFEKALAAERAKGKLDASNLSRDIWYKNSFIYTADIKMFKDSDGDGIGDINGMIEKLDYIKALGADIIWLPPFQPTSDLDDGYDITNYYAVDPRLGTMNDFKRLIHEAGKRGLRVMIDLVLNHTSDQHPWFKQARQAQSPYRGWYVWSHTKPDSKDKDPVFKNSQDGIWTFDSIAHEYYYHRFYKFEPDLNTQLPAVKNEMKHIMNFWLATGIIGFRIDAVTYLTELAETNGKDFKHDRKLLQEIRQLTTLAKPDNILLGEANVPAGETEEFFGKHGEALNMIFNFYADQRIFYAMATEQTATLKTALSDSKDIPLQSAWVYFLRNQDEMGMGRFKEKERQEVYQAFAPEKNMQLYDRGVRRRLAPMLGNNLQRLKLAYSLLFAIPGVLMIRYGDEIAMGDDLNLKERLAVRTPMQWNNSSNAGFSITPKTLRPVIADGAFGYRAVNVMRSDKDSASLLNWIKQLAALRKKHPSIAFGDWKILDTDSPNIIAIEYNWKGDTLLTIHNFSSKQQPVELSINKDSASLQSLLKGNGIVPAKGGSYQLMMDPYGYRWYIIQ